MAGLRFTVAPPPQASGTATRTLSQIVAAANRRVRVEKVRVSGDAAGQNTETPVLCQLVKQTAAGTSVATTEIAKKGNDDEAIQTTALDTFTSTEPTTTDIHDQKFIEPGKSVEFDFPLDADGDGGLYVMGGERMAVRLVSPAVDNDYAVAWHLDE